jgi:hypothetical protein
MLSGVERAKFASDILEEVRRWPGVELRQHASATTPGEADGVEFRLNGKQIGHVHGDGSLHLAFTKALKASLVVEQLAEPLFSPSSGWAQFTPITPDDAQRAIWLLRVNYVRLRRQRLTPQAAESSELLHEHEAALGTVSESVLTLLHRTQARSKPRPLPSLDGMTTSPRLTPPGSHPPPAA